jgi:uncharacterized protein (DUF1330 family)
MKTIAVLLSGVAFGAIGMFAAQSYAIQGNPGIYVVSETDIGNPDAYRNDWSPKVVPILRRHGAEFLASGGAGNSITAGGNTITPLSPESRDALPPNRRMVVTAFPDMAHVQAWINDPEYQKLKQETLTKGTVKLFRSYAIDATAPAANN